MSGTPQRTVTLPSRCQPTQAAAESLSQTSLPYDWMFEAMRRATARRRPDGFGLGPARSHTASIVCPRKTSVSMGWPTGRTSPRARALRLRMSAGEMPSSRATRSICDSYPKTTCMPPKPRKAEVGGVLVYAQRARNRTLPNPYGPHAHYHEETTTNDQNEGERD